MNGTEKAAFYTSGGLRAVPEGLPHSGVPCATVLSVAGLLATMGGFPLGREEYPEVKEASFLRENGSHC